MTLGIALGGGGARGFAHIGVLETLQEAGIDFSVVSGTSVGSLVGAVYASDNLSELKEASQNIKLTEIPFLLTPALSRHGFFSGVNALEFLSNFIDVDEIEQLNKRFAAVSVDIEASKLVTYTSGNVRQAIRASMAIPCIFTPIIEGSQVLVDGGILEPVPVQAARDLGANFIVAVDLFGTSTETSVHIAEELKHPIEDSSTLAEKSIEYLNKIGKTVSHALSKNQSTDNRIPHIIAILERTLSVGQQHLTELRLKENPPDIIIRPHLEDIGLFDFHRGGLGIERGKQAALAVLEEIQASL